MRKFKKNKQIKSIKLIFIPKIVFYGFLKKFFYDIFYTNAFRKIFFNNQKSQIESLSCDMVFLKYVLRHSRHEKYLLDIY